MEWFPLKILEGGYSLCGKRWGATGKFNVPFCRLYFVVSGKAKVIFGKNELELRGGNAYFLPGNIISQDYCDDFMEVLWIHFAPMSLWLEYFLVNYKEAYIWSLENLESWKNVYIQLKQFPFAKNSPESYKLQSLLIYLTADLLSSKNQTLSNEPYLKLKNAFTFMDKEYLNNPSLKMIAQRAHMAPNYFHRKFKEAFPNFTPHSYMEAKRMRNAKALLATGLSLKEISEATGYSNVFYFSRSFKKVFGKSPSLARKEINP